MGDELALLRARERSLEALRTRRRELEERTVLLALERDELSRAGSEAASGLTAKGNPPLDWGELGGLRPLSPEWGADRGRCIDRWYIEGFLEEHAAVIRGRVLELHDDDYTRRFGGTLVSRSEVLDIDSTNPGASICGDLEDLPQVADGSFDAVILTQTLHYVPRMARALATCRRLLAPGGALLVTVPCLSRVAPEEGLDGDRWRLTPAGLRLILRRAFPLPDQVTVEGRGNLLTSIAFLEGLACEDLSEGDFLPHDPWFPLLVVGCAVRSGAP